MLNTEKLQLQKKSAAQIVIFVFEGTFSCFIKKKRYSLKYISILFFFCVENRNWTKIKNYGSIHGHAGSLWKNCSQTTTKNDDRLPI